MIVGPRSLGAVGRPIGLARQRQPILSIRRFDLGPRLAVSSAMPGNLIAQPDNLAAEFTAYNNAATFSGGVLYPTATNDFHFYQITKSKAAASQLWMLATVLTPAGAPTGVLQADDGGNAGAIAKMNMANGAVSVSTYGSGFTPRQSPQVTPWPGGGWLLRLLVSTTAATSIRAIIGTADASGSQQYTANASQGVGVKGIGFASVAGINAAASTALTTPSTKPLVIFDTDLDTDPDDIADLALLCRLAQLGEVDIAAVVTDGADAYSASYAKACLAYAGFGSVPIGAYQGNGSDSAALPGTPLYTQSSAAAFGYTQPRTAYPDAVSVMRQTLVNAPRSVTIVCTGTAQNLGDLLASPADGISPLTGAQLISAKVRRLYLCAGVFPSAGSPEYNLTFSTAQARAVARDWPTEVVWPGIELGNTIFTQVSTLNGAAGNPFRNAWNRVPSSYYDGQGRRQAWGQMAVYPAVRGLSTAGFGASPVGATLIDANGLNDWVGVAGQSAYLTKTASDATIQTAIQNLLNAI